jgi:hypothetical protein
VYATAWRFLNTVLDNTDLNDFFVRETQRTLRKVYFEPATSTPEVSIEFASAGQITFENGEKTCQFILNFCLPLYSNESAKVALEFLDLFYYTVQQSQIDFYNSERKAGRVPRIKLYSMSPGVMNLHDENDFCVVSIALVLGMYEDIA